jgi:FAD/FMN-containing dehydrogenase
MLWRSDDARFKRAVDPDDIMNPGKVLQDV